MMDRIRQTWKGLVTARWPLVLIAAGFVLVWQFGVLGSLATDFLLIAPAVTGLAFLFSKVLWDSVFAAHGFRLSSDPWLSLCLFLGIFLGLCLLVG